jgi:hypothetical protein
MKQLELKEEQKAVRAAVESTIANDQPLIVVNSKKVVEDPETRTCMNNADVYIVGVNDDESYAMVASIIIAIAQTTGQKVSDVVGKVLQQFEKISVL